jgi:SHS2 domain-containing protein
MVPDPILGFGLRRRFRLCTLPITSSIPTRMGTVNHMMMVSTDPGSVRQPLLRDIIASQPRLPLDDGGLDGRKMRVVRVPYEIIEHPADVGFIAYGRTLAELFENAALAMSSIGCAGEQVEETTSREILAHGADLESLLYAWLAEILGIADAEQLVFRRFAISQIEEPQRGAPGQARGIAYGEVFDRERHAAGTYIKAVTLHQFIVERTLEGFLARVFLDL